MVLLSFFIVFFSIQDDSPMHFIIQDLAKLSGKSKTSGNETDSGTPSGATQRSGTIESDKRTYTNSPPISSNRGPQSTTENSEYDYDSSPQIRARLGQPSDVLDRLAGMIANSVLTEQRKVKRLTINLPDNIYEVGGYAVPTEALTPLINELIPFQAHLEITIVGHSDQIRFAPNEKKIMRDNTTLSSVRAAYSATFLQRALPQSKVWTQAEFGDIRHSRSLSILLEERAQ
jgi:flagellar motor protein MotB